MKRRPNLSALLALCVCFALSCAASASRPDAPASPKEASPAQPSAPQAPTPGADAAAGASAPQEPNMLAGTDWTVTAYNNGQQAVVSVIGGTEVTARFGSDGRVTGRAGCNHYFAAYRTEGGALAVEAAGATRMHCGEPAGMMEQEQQYLAALQSASSFEVAGDVMTLRTAGGETAVTLTKRAP